MEGQTEKTTEQIQAETWARDTNSIYAGESASDRREEPERIKDIGAAQEAAQAEGIAHMPGATPASERIAMGAAIALEKNAEVEASKLDGDQKKNIEWIKGVAERHPGTLVEEIDGDERYWRIVGNKANEQLYFSADGVWAIIAGSERDAAEISLKKATDIAKARGGRSNAAVFDVLKNGGDPQKDRDNITVFKLDLNDEQRSGWLIRAIAEGDMIVSARDKAEKESDVWREKLKDI